MEHPRQAAPAVPFLPEVVASSTGPLLLITRRVPGTSLFDTEDDIIAIGHATLRLSAGTLIEYLDDGPP